MNEQVKYTLFWITYQHFSFKADSLVIHPFGTVFYCLPYFEDLLFTFRNLNF